MLVIGIPALNEEERIGEVVRRAKKEADIVVVCDDGSKDRTAHVAASYGANVIVHGINLGYGAAIASLFEWAKEKDADILVTLDGDGQHNPEDVPIVVAPIKSGDADFVIGSRFTEGSSSEAGKPRNVGIRAITRLVSIEHVTDAVSGFRAYDRKALRLVEPTEAGMSASTEILRRVEDNGLSIAEVPIHVSYNEGSHTHNLLYDGLDVILGTVKQKTIRHPLIYFGIPGLLLLLNSAFFLWWTIDLWGVKGYIVTNVALVAAVSAIVGMVFCVLAYLVWILVSVVKEK